MLVDPKVRKGETKEAYRERMEREMKDAPAKQRRLLQKGKIQVVMDVDDFGFLLPGYDDLLRLKKSLPGLKITCFTIPLDNAFFDSKNAQLFTWEKYKRWAEIVNQHDWIEVAVHGFSHVYHEGDVNYEKANLSLGAVENLFDRVGLEYVKIYKAPFWQYSYDMFVALKERGWIIAIDRNYPRLLPEGSHAFVYNWSFEEPLPMANPIKGHGHFVGRNKNNISDTLGNILDLLPRETQFKFISEYAKENNDYKGEEGTGEETGTEKDRGAEEGQQHDTGRNNRR